VIGVVGGSGDFGRGLAERLRRLGEDVIIGSRNPREEFVSNPEACRRSDIVFLSVPAENAVAMAAALAEELQDHVVVSVASSLRPPAGSSIAEQSAAAAPGARFVAGFHTVSAKLLGELDHVLDEDVLLCGDDDDAKERVAALADRIVAGRAVDCGGLRTARRLEGLTGLLVGVNKRYRTNAGVRITGLS
jgi:8-hydroxy-5-deazaflavin:NADPH oxidoreductase